MTEKGPQATARHRGAPGLWGDALRRLARNRGAVAGGAVFALFLLMALAAPLLSPHDLIRLNVAESLEPPSLRHWLGTDQFGRDVLARIIHGARVSMAMGVAAVTISVVLGSALGLLSGYYRGPVDLLVMRVVDGMLAFPYIVVAVFLAAFLGPGLPVAVIAIGIASAPGYIRLVRGIVLTVRGQEYIGAAVASGATRLRVALHHILPNSISPVIVFASLDAASALIRLSSLSFIGMGAQPPMPEWGTMLNAAQEWLSVSPHISMAPGLAIVLAAVALNLVGEAFRDALDPRLMRLN